MVPSKRPDLQPALANRPQPTYHARFKPAEIRRLAVCVPLWPVGEGLESKAEAP